MYHRIHRRTLLAGSLATTLAARSAAFPNTPLFAQEEGRDWTAVEEALGGSGQMMGGDVFRVGMPRTDLAVTVQGVPIATSFALGSWAAFKRVDTEFIVDGDLVLLDEEINDVMSGLFQGGLMIAALHNHLNEMEPHVMYLHFAGRGEDPVALAETIGQALSASGTPRGQQQAGGAAATPTVELPADEIADVLGYSGELSDSGVLGFGIQRAESIAIPAWGLDDVPPAMGTGIGINFQPIGDGQAAITGDFVLLADEVNPVAQTLREHGIEVHALHNHFLTEEPRLFYMHFFATGDPAELARGLRAALDHVTVAPPADAAPDASPAPNGEFPEGTPDA